MANQVLASAWYGNHVPAFQGIECKKCGQPRSLIIEKSGKRRYRCRPCDSEAGREGRRAYYLANKDRWANYQEKRLVTGKHWDAYLRRRYGITAATYDQLDAAQAGLCAVCGQPETRRIGARSIRDGSTRTPLCVDHNHDTGQVRGLLCHSCNTLIGHARESIDTLTSAVAYLRRHNGGE